MINTTFPYNPTLSSMTYKPEDETCGALTLVFKKRKGYIENRSYNVSRDIAYKMFYSKSAADVLDNFNTYIKNKARVINVTKQ